MSHSLLLVRAPFRDPAGGTFQEDRMIVCRDSRRVFLTTVLTVFGWLSAESVTGQTPGSIRGTVRDAEGNAALAGAQISIEALRVGTVSNADGRYSVANVPAGTHSVTVTLIGFAAERRSLTVTAGAATVADFVMRTQVLGMSEIVVTGVTEATSTARLPFTVAKVSKEDMPVPPRTAESAIQGKVAGVTIVQSTQPGEAAAIMLRTPVSINRNTSPLIVVDGTILTSSIVDISSLDIESIEVIKGAAAASLYGSRAGAGVLQIRTTRGSSIPENRTRFSMRTEYGSSDIPHPIEWARQHPYRLNAQGQFLNSSNQVVERRQDAAFKPVPFQDGTYPTPIFDHVKSLFDPGANLTQHASFGYNGGNTSWLASGSYHRTEGVTLELDGYRRADFRVNLDHRLANAVSFSSSLFHLRSTQDDPFGGALFDFINIAPDVNLLQPDEDGTKYAFQPDDDGIRPNPLYGLATQTHEDKRQRTLASLDIRYNPVSWIGFDVNGSYDRSDRNNLDWVPKGVKTPDFPDGDEPGSLGRLSAQTSGINASVGASLSRDFGSLRTRTTARALIERQDAEEIEANGEVFSVGGLPDLNAITVAQVESNSSKVRSTGYFLTSDMDWADKYIVSGLVRRDGSSLFGADERWHTYYRMSGAYRVTEEPWWPVPAINEFKLRYSRGTAGGRPNFADRYEVFSVQTGGGLQLVTLGNPALKPEHSTEQEFGIDLVALSRVSLQLTYAKQRTIDQLVSVPLPRIFGFGTKWENAGTVEGYTYEATLEARLVERPNLRWSMNLVADRSRNKIAEYDRPCHTDNRGFRCAGETLGMLYGDKFLDRADELPAAVLAARDQFQVNDDGLLVWVGAGNTWRDGLSNKCTPTNAAGTCWGTTTSIAGQTFNWGMPIKLVDSTGATRRVKIGDSNPDFKVGVANSVTWKGINLYALVDAQVGGDIYNATKQRMYQHQRHHDEDQAGKPDERKKPITYYTPGLYNADVDISWFVEDASFVKLREVSLRYTLDRARFAPLARVGLERASLSLIGRNLHYWTGYSGYDPEVNGSGQAHTRADDFDFPSYRTITASIEIIF
ncbi:MAG: SusC/RagA family TonB-linked outer membrane protein [Gemmatimonadota bacterium]